jgi:hypothetical protein
MTEKYKPGGALKSFLDAGKKPSRVLGSVERYVLSKPTDKSRRTDVLHPSEMAGDEWCYRASYFQLKGHLPLESSRRNSLRLQSVFAEGHGIHAKWQRWFQEMGHLYGKWYCKDCDEYFWGGSDCHEGPLEYKEVPLFYEPLRIFGHADGWLTNFGDPLMLEVKSIGFGTIRWENPEMAKEFGTMEKVWPEIKAPFAKHVTQVQIYMKLAELLGYDNYPREAVLIYENKATQDVKEFVVPKSDFAIAPLFEAAAMIVESINNNTPPACNLDKWGGCSKCGGYNE